MAIDDRIRSARSARGITQLELARRANISRLALGAIESGVYQSSGMVALSLARELDETVERLFADNEKEPCSRIDVSWSDPEMAAGGAAYKVALARVGGKVVAMRQPAVRLWISPRLG